MATVPSALRCNAMLFEQRLHNQKYSVLSRLAVAPKLLSAEAGEGSASSRKSLPSWRYRNEAEHDGLAHFASIQTHRTFSTCSLFRVVVSLSDERPIPL